MGNETDTSTEVQQTGAENLDQSSGAGEAQQTQENQFAGVHSRINELTAKFRNEERRSAQLEARNAELIAQLTAIATQRTQPQQEQLEIDPDEKKKMEYFLSPLQKQLQDMQARLAATGAGDEVRPYVKQGTPPEVVDHAVRQVAEWRKQGIGPDRGTAQAALTYAMGEYVLNKGVETETSRSQAKAFNGSAASVQSSNGSGTRTSAKKTLSEAELEQLSPEDLEQYYGSKVDPDEAF